MRDFKAALILCALLAFLALTACGGGESTEVSAKPGKELFEQATLGGAAGCKTCHSLEPGVTIIGPSLADIGSAAGSKVSGLSGEEYLRQSITDPNAYVVDGYPASVMPNVYGERLTGEQIDQLLAYMLSLKGDSG